MVISLSSFLAKNKEITGDVLNKAHPIPMGRVLNTICCNNIPKLVPRSIESKNLEVAFFWKRGVCTFKIVAFFENYEQRNRYYDYSNPWFSC